MSGRLKVLTIVGTRPEIIRLSRVIAALEEWTDHVLVHTGQNYDYELNEIFFEELGLRRPDYFLEADTSSLGAVLGDVLRGTERVLHEERPDAMVVLGDTNSCVSALMARRMKVPVYHLEAGNRSFDPNVPEEINRHLVDHVADYNLVYTEHSRRNLLAEGLHPSKVMLTGSPMREVLDYYRPQVEASTALERLSLERDGYLLASIHREENVDDPLRLQSVFDALMAVAETHHKPVLISTHPRTRKRMRAAGIKHDGKLIVHSPMGFFDYVNLQLNALCVLSDSGTISEEATILGFRAVTVRDAIERPEAVESGGIVVSGLNPADLVDAASLVIHSPAPQDDALPSAYAIADTSARVLRIIRSTASTHHARTGVRVPSNKPPNV